MPYTAIGDLPVVATSWATMLALIAAHHHLHLKDAQLRRIATGVFAGVSAWYLGSKIAQMGIMVAFSVCTFGLALLTIGPINGAINAYFTWRIGKTFNEVCESFSEDDVNDKIASNIITYIIKHVIHVPSLAEIKEFKEFWF